jgi:hypothetical protein
VTGIPASHNWSYAEPPRLATERHCKKCGTGCRRRDALASWQDDVEVRAGGGGEWTAVARVPHCDAPDFRVRFPCPAS